MVLIVVDEMVVRKPAEPAAGLPVVVSRSSSEESAAGSRLTQTGASQPTN